MKRKSISIGFYSLGCAKNRVDSEIIAKKLLDVDYILAAQPEEADIIFINTCSFIQAAREEAYEIIQEVCSYKKDGQYIIVCGCLPQLEGELILKKFPAVDGVFGVDEVARVEEIIKRILEAKDVSSRVIISPNPSIRIEPPENRIIFTGAPYAYIKIAEGCNHQCAFCTIPAIRGKFRSRTIASILREAEELLSNGIRELNLIAQDVTSYGVDINTSFLELLTALNKLGKNFWIRWLYGHPARMTEHIVAAIGELDNVCKYFDLPAQHSHPEILKAMKRPYDIKLKNVFTTIRKIVPEASIRSTFIVGFPGETEAHFLHLLEFIKEVEFDQLATFMFSPEAGTPAAGMPNQIKKATAEERYILLMETQKKIVAKKLAAKLGQKEKVLLEHSKGKDKWLGRTQGQAPEVDSVVYVRKVPEKIKSGTFAYVLLKGKTDYDLKAEWISDESG